MEGKRERNRMYWMLLGLLVFAAAACFQGQDFFQLLADGIKRVGMQGVLTLAMVPAILCGIGPNFGVSIGILCGLLGMCIAMEAGLSGIQGFFAAMGLAFLFSAIGGFLYGRLLNRLYGNEMAASTYIGFSAVALFSFVWLLAPFQNSSMVLTMGGQGLRNTISLEGIFSGCIDKLVTFSLFGKEFLLGGTMFFFIFCFLFWLFLQTPVGIAMRAAGQSRGYAEERGISIYAMRILGTVLSTALGAAGILFYSQSYGFMQLYQAPLLMPFSAVSAILLGGASVERAKVTHAVLGTVFFQFLFAFSIPVLNTMLPDGSADAVRMVVTYGILLFVLCQKSGRKQNETI